MAKMANAVELDSTGARRPKPSTSLAGSTPAGRNAGSEHQQQDSLSTHQRECYNLNFSKQKPSDKVTAMGKKPKKSPPKAKSKPGPTPELFKIEGMNWEEAVTKSFKKKKPAGGWPK